VRRLALPGDGIRNNPLLVQNASQTHEATHLQGADGAFLLTHDLGDLAGVEVSHEPQVGIGDYTGHLPSRPCPWMGSPPQLHGHSPQEELAVNRAGTTNYAAGAYAHVLEPASRLSDEIPGMRSRTGNLATFTPSIREIAYLHDDRLGTPQAAMDASQPDGSVKCQLRSV
jgi:hypothetical protein